MRNAFGKSLASERNVRGGIKGLTLHSHHYHATRTTDNVTAVIYLWHVICKTLFVCVCLCGRCDKSLRSDGGCNWSSTDTGRSKKLAGVCLRPGLILVNGLPPPFLAMHMVAECLRGAISFHLVPGPSAVHVLTTLRSVQASIALL